MAIGDRVIRILRQSPLYPFYRRNLSRYRKIRDLARWTDGDQERLEFYKQFIGSGDLAFDVGANLGNRSKVFLKLGAEVIAFEPQPHCADILERVYKNNTQFHLVRKALGARKDTGEMAIGDIDLISSLSKEWIDATQESGRLGEYQWRKQISVEIDTLDNMIAEYGCPKFVKIDVEGYEFEVLSGLSQPLETMSIEFTPELIERTHKCIDHICKLAEMEFQISIHESMSFALPAWVSRQEIKNVLSRIDPAIMGDLYLRRISNPTMRPCER